MTPIRIRIRTINRMVPRLMTNLLLVAGPVIEPRALPFLAAVQRLDRLGARGRKFCTLAYTRHAPAFACEIRRRRGDPARLPQQPLRSLACKRSRLISS